MLSPADQIEQNENETEYRLLITRARSYSNATSLSDSDESSNKSSLKKVLMRNKLNLQCKLHHKQDWSKECVQCNDCINIEQNDLPNGKLPTLRVVIGYISKLRNDERYSSNSAHEEHAALDIMMHWIYCNVYTITKRCVVSKLKEAMSKYKHFKSYPTSKKKDKNWNDYEEFVKSCHMIFDIKYKTEERRVMQERLWNVKMTKDDEQFYQKMCQVPQSGYCSTFIDRKWQKTAKRKLQEDASLAKRKEESGIYMQGMRPVDDECDVDEHGVLYKPDEEVVEDRFT